jgi:hypothetical protein
VEAVTTQRPTNFFYAYRLLSANSLIKPPRRASVMTVPVQVLGCLKSSLHQPTVQQVHTDNIEQRLDSLLQQDSNNIDEDLNLELFSEVDQDYRSSSLEECIQHYLSGYVAHKLRKFTTPAENVFKFLFTMSEPPLTPSSLCYLPSVPLTQLLSFLETCIQKYSSKLHVDIYKTILDECLSADELATLTL